MATIPGFRLDITGASGSQGLLSPRQSWRAYVFPRGAFASQDSTGSLITFDSSLQASRFAVNNWIQVGTDTSKIVKVTAVGGNSISVNASVTVATNDRIFLIGNTQPSVSGGSATYITPNTLVRQRGDDSATLYSNSMITTNANGLVQGFASPAMYDVLVQDGNGSNQGYVANLEVGTVEGISASDVSFFGATVTITAGLSVSGVAAFGQTVTIGTTGSLVSMRGPGGVRYASQFATGSSTSGIQEAINDLPSGGGLVVLDGNTTYSIQRSIGPKAGTTVRGAGRSTLVQKAFNGDIFGVTAANVVLQDFRIDGVSASFTGAGIWATSQSSNVTVDRLEIVACSSHHVALVGSQNGKVRDCRITVTTNAFGVAVMDGAHNAIVLGNYIDLSGSSGGSAFSTCIGVRTQSIGQTLSNVLISGNNLISGSGFAVECYTVTGGTRLTNVSMVENVCIAGQNCDGLISYAGDGINGGVISGNILDANGKTIKVAPAAGIELTTCTAIAVSGNYLNGGTSWKHGIYGGNCNDSSITANTINGFTTTTGDGIVLTCNSGSADRNVISANRIIMPNNSSTSVGIYLQSNGSTATVNDCAVIGNVISSDGLANTIGIKLEALIVGGTISNALVTGNVLYSLHNAIGIVGATTITGAYIDGNNFRGVTNAFNTLNQAIVLATDSINLRTSIIYLTGNTTTTLTSAPTLADGFDTQEVFIVNTGTAGTITVQDQGTLPSSNLRLGAATRALSPRDSLRLKYNATIGDWIEVAFNNVT